MTTVSIGDGSNFDGNNAEDSDGGAVSVVGSVRLRIESGVQFVRNSAAERGGAICVLGPSNVSIDDSSFIENESKFSGGGAVFVEASAFSLQLAALTHGSRTLRALRRPF